MTGAGRLGAALSLGAALLLAGVAPATPLAAQGAIPRGQPRRAPAAEGRAEAVPALRVFLLTMGQGDAVWEKFGHNAIWIRDEASGTNVAYNWGVFDFDQPNFLQRFLTGDTRYWLAAEDASAMVQAYVDRNRTVWAQELDLDAEQRARLLAFVEWNARPENRYYRYDYFRDNCSTRARDALDLALGGRIRLATAERPSGSTYYSHSARLTGRDIPVYTGITLGLGQPANRPISAWEEMFIPMEMMRHLRAVRVTGATGASRPLVKSELVIFQARRQPEPERPPPYLPYYVAAGLLLGGLVALLGRLGARGSRAARAAWLAAVEVWSVLCGVIGVLMILAWTLTSHVYTRSNENFLQFEPLSLLLAVLLPLARTSAGARAARALAWTIAAVALAGALLNLVPAFYQDNGPIVALALPVHLAVAWSVSMLRRPAAAGDAASRTPTRAERARRAA